MNNNSLSNFFKTVVDKWDTLSDKEKDIACSLFGEKHKNELYNIVEHQIRKQDKNNIENLLFMECKILSEEYPDKNYEDIRAMAIKYINETMNDWDGSGD